MKQPNLYFESRVFTGTLLCLLKFNGSCGKNSNTYFVNKDIVNRARKCFLSCSIQVIIGQS